jgi:hypothetical protein
MIDAQLRIRSGTTEKTVSLGSYLDPAAEEAAHQAEYEWIKGLRSVQIEGETLRDRFTVRGDSLWWFSEIYLHKQQTILNIHRAIAAFEALAERERPSSLDVISAPTDVHHVLAIAAAAKGFRGQNAVDPRVWSRRLRTLTARARRLMWAAHLSPERLRRPPPSDRQPPVAAFIHRAFWRRGGEDGSAESYIGPVLQELEGQLGPGGVRYVGIGPSENFRAQRSWRHRPSPGPHVVPIERYAGFRSLATSVDIWRDRQRNLRVLTASRSLRDMAVIRGVDTWPIVHEQLAGVTWLQWPWSARAMDEAAAALDAIEPGVAVTYAEAGGWGRALILEARRRRIPCAGLQHGFIYRHWLNYRHEPDEMRETKTARFPAPTRTLLFDEFAGQHLQTAGRFEDGSLVVTGSPRLDELARTLAALPADAVARTRQDLSLQDDERLVLLVTKEREARPWLPALYDAIASVGNAVLVVKPHPAETAEAYASAAGHRKVRLLSPSTPLGPLLASAGAVVTVNSTVALDAAVLDIPALAMALPNNLSPFVEAGALSGTAHPRELADLLSRILYDEGFRQQLSDRRRSLLGRHAMTADGRSAARCADVIRELVRQGKGY